MNYKNSTHILRAKLYFQNMNNNNKRSIFYLNFILYKYREYKTHHKKSEEK